MTLSSRIHWSIDYTTRFNGLLQILKKQWHVVSDIQGCELFPRVGYKRTCSIKEILVSADALQNNDTHGTLPMGHFRCGACSVCCLSLKGKQIEFQDHGFVHVWSQF